MAVLWEVVVDFVAGWLPTGCQPPINGKKITEKKNSVKRAVKETSVSGVFSYNFLYPTLPKGSLSKTKKFQHCSKNFNVPFPGKKPPAGCHKTEGFNSIEERWLLSLKWVEVFYKKETNTKSKVQKKTEKYQGEKKDTNG